MKRCLGVCLAGLLMTSVSSRESRADSRYTLITILHTNDIHGRVMPRGEPGGLARIATLVRQIRAEMPNVVLLDAGDIIHGTPEDYLSAGKASIGAMNALGYQLAAAGNHEFDFGLPVMRGVMAEARFPFLAANIRAALGGQWDRIAQHAILDIDGVRLVVLGLATLETVTLHWPNSIKEIVVEDPIETAGVMVPQLKAESDVLIVLSHLGDVLDAQLARAVPGIDFIIGGHSHTSISNWRWVGDTLIAQAGALGRALGRIDFIVRKDESGAQIASVNGRHGDWSSMPNPPLDRKYPKRPLIPVDNSIAEDQALREAYMPFRVDADARLAEVIAQAPEGVPGRASYRTESPAGNLVADAVRAFAQADVAVIDASSLAASGLPAGPVTVKSVFDLIGGYTRQHIAVARITGEGIRTALDKAFAKKRAINLAVSGLLLECEVRGPAPVVCALSIGGAPVEPSQAYTVAAQAYVMMDIMEAVPGIEIVSEPSETTREALIGYLKSAGALTLGTLDRVRSKQ